MQVAVAPAVLARTIMRFQASICFCSAVSAPDLYAAYMALTQLWSVAGGAKVRCASVWCVGSRCLVNLGLQGWGAPLPLPPTCNDQVQNVHGDVGGDALDANRNAACGGNSVQVRWRRRHRDEL